MLILIVEIELLMDGVEVQLYAPTVGLNRAALRASRDFLVDFSAVSFFCAF